MGGDFSGLKRKGEKKKPRKRIKTFKKNQFWIPLRLLDLAPQAIVS